MNVFRRQMTEDIITFLKDNNILLVRVSENMTDIFQSLDLAVNGTFKTFMRKKFSEWYSKQIRKHTLENGYEVMDVEVDVKLTILKPLRAK